MPKKRSTQRKEEYVHYVTTVTGWEHMYGLSIGGRSRFDDGPYSEFAVLKLTGEVIRPEKYKFPKAEVRLSE